MVREEVRDPSVRELIIRLGEQVSMLIRAELALARAEIFASARQAVIGGNLFGAAAVVGLGAWLAMVAAAIAGVATALPVWASALIIGAALALTSLLLALAGRARLARSAPPLAMTAESVRRDIGELTGRNAGL